MRAYAEIVKFLVSSPSLQEIVQFYPSEATWDRVKYLHQAHDKGSITSEEMAELHEFARVQHFLDKMRLRAARRLDSDHVGTN